MNDFTTRQTFVFPILLAVPPIRHLARVARIWANINHEKVRIQRKREPTGKKEMVPCLGASNHSIDLSQLQTIHRQYIMSENQATIQTILSRVGHKWVGTSW